MNVESKISSHSKPSVTASGRSVSKVLHKLNGQRYLQIMALVGVAWMFVFNYVPMYGIIIAFKEFNIVKSISDAPWVGLEHFKAILEDENLGYVVKNTLGMSILKLLIGFPLPIVFALFLNELRSVRFKRLVQTISYLPHFLSWVILGGILATWLADTGIINKILIGLHVMKEPVSFLAEPQYFWSIIIASDIWKELGWSAIIYLAAIAGVSPEMFEAATIDGAGRFQKMLYVTLPSIKGTITILFILAVSGILNSNFDQILVLKNQLNESSSNVIDVYVYQTGIVQGRYSYATAVGLIKSIISLILLLSANFITKRLSNTSLF
ncbi:ABC transporter permease [Paenibacillus tyrfis]|uniref:ABC transporter permease n=1 Tax=Paenibacillus tyrfis TaxID=1501230 RepID=UPI0020A1A72A|nr:ABC transporter permease subunit [Paenibacillus tyrfis]MCP1311582.1 ABC transporter permease subunit [Paenibacillus tyrfis]